MKNKIVIWGTNATDEKVLIALELHADANKVLLHTFPEAIVSEEFLNKMMAEWRTGTPVEFPEGHSTLERELSMTENLLPDDLKVERGNDLIQRAQTEWHFVVLSTKLHKAYEQELADFKEKVQALSSYDHKVWDSLREFWEKVQEQARERNLFRSHADNLRDNINELFDDLKKKRKRVQEEFINTSRGVLDEFNQLLADVESRIAAGGSKLHTVFEDLKQLQRRYRDAKLSNEHRNQLWERLDKAFKSAKERKFGPGANDGSLIERHQRRLHGMREAVKRMEDSIRHDEDDLEFQKKKVATTEGQLEAQIRSAKIKMIEERVRSKREKLSEMYKTCADVERQIASAQNKESKRVEKEAERRKIEAAKVEAKKEIEASIKSKAAEGDAAPAADEPSTPPPAEQPAEEEAPEKGESLFGAVGAILNETLEDVVDTVKAVGSVLSEKADEVLEDAVEKVEEVVEVIVKEKKKATKKKAAEKPEAAAAETTEATPENPAASPADVSAGTGEDQKDA